METSTDNTNWTDTTGNTATRTRYMRTSTAPAHTHDFTYTASGDAIIAICSADGCTLTDNKVELTIVAPTRTDNGETAAAASNAATVKVIKATPEYSTPTDVKAVAGNTLESVTLPEGWTWAGDTIDVGDKGLNTFKAIFTPDDTTNYNTVENVDVNVNVFEYHGEVSAECKNNGVKAYYEDGEGHRFSDLGETQLTDEQTVIEKLGHKFINFLKWLWDGFKSAVIRLTCDNCEQVETKDVPSKIDTIDEPTCTEDGCNYYVATIDVAGKIYTTVNVETVDQFGHKWTQSEWTIDGTKASVTLVCENYSNHTKKSDAAGASAI